MRCCCPYLAMHAQSANFFEEIAYYDYDGISDHQNEKELIMAALGRSHSVLVMRNHGVCTTGRTVAEAWVKAWYFEKCCRLQVRLPIRFPVTYSCIPHPPGCRLMCSRRTGRTVSSHRSCCARRSSRWRQSFQTACSSGQPFEPSGNSSDITLHARPCSCPVYQVVEFIPRDAVMSAQQQQQQHQHQHQHEHQQHQQHQQQQPSPSPSPQPPTSRPSRPRRQKRKIASTWRR